MKIIFGQHGQIFAFDKNGQQVGELQEHTPILFAHYASSIGFAPETFDIEMSNGSKIKIIKQDDPDNPWNYQIL